MVLRDVQSMEGDETPAVVESPKFDSENWTASPQLHFALTATQTFFLGGIFILALLGVCYLAANILLPIFLAILLKFVLHPLVRGAQRYKIPPALSSVLIIGCLFIALYGIGSAVSGPLGKWTVRIQEGLPNMKEQVESIKGHLTGMQTAIANAEHIVPGTGTKTMMVTVEGTTFTDRLLMGTRQMVTGLLETIVFLLFLLVSGDTFLRRLVEVLPRFKDKKHAVAISQQVESDLSGYLRTITLANACVGLATGLAMKLCGVEDPLLWAALAFIVNYIPILGPIVMMGLILLAGVSSFPLPYGLVPVGVYIGIHLLESQVMTPLLLARRFTLNPVMVILSLTFWFWMWGIVGAILATPMLAVTKIICDRIEFLQPIGHILEGGSSRDS